MRRCLVAALLFSLAACDDGSAFEHFVAMRERIHCAKAFACCAADEVRDVVPSRPQSCRPARSADECAVLSSWYATLLRPEEKGRFRFHADRGQACVAAVQRASCAEYFSELRFTDCDTAIEGLVLEGGECADDWECAWPLWCQFEIGAPRRGVCTSRDYCGREEYECGEGEFCHRRGCEPLRKAGEPCSEPDMCELSAYCSETMTCVARTGEGGMCVHSSRCATGFYCPYPPGATATCTPLPSAGAACANDTACASGLFCDYASGAPVCAMRKAEGATCRHDEECLRESCDRGRKDGVPAEAGVCRPQPLPPSICGGSIRAQWGWACPWI